MYRWSLFVCSFLLACSHFSTAQESETISPGLVFSQADLELLKPAGFKPAATQLLPKRYAGMVQELCSKHEVEWQLVASVIRAESNFKSTATSARGARGLMQLTPRTASRYQVAADELYDPYKNLDAGIRHLKMLMDRYAGNLELVLAAYNTGEFTVDRYRGIPPFRTTRSFIKKVLQQYLAAF